MVYSIDSMHLNYDHMSTTQFISIFTSASCVQQQIIPKMPKQIYIVAHHWKEEILSFPTVCHISKSNTCIKLYQESSYDHSYMISPIGIDRSTLTECGEMMGIT